MEGCKGQSTRARTNTGNSPNMCRQTPCAAVEAMCNAALLGILRTLECICFVFRTSLCIRCKTRLHRRMMQSRFAVLQVAKIGHSSASILRDLRRRRSCAQRLRNQSPTQLHLIVETRLYAFIFPNRSAEMISTVSANTHRIILLATRCSSPQ